MAPPAMANLRKLGRRFGVAVLVLLALYAAAGFLVVPRVARRLIEKKGSEALHREVKVAAVAFNPFTLRATVRGLSVRDRDGAPLLGWDTLVVRPRLLALLRRNIGVAELRLVRPQVRVALGRDGRPSFQDLLEPASEEPAPPTKPEAPQPEEPGYGLEVGLLSIEEAQVAFIDGTHQPAFEKTLGPASFRLADFVTRAGGRSDFSFGAATEAGERLAWKGTVEMEPIRTSGTLELSGLRMDRYKPYTRDQVPAEVRAGTAALKARYEVLWAPEKQSIRVRDASLAVEGLRIGRAGVAQDDVQLPSFAVTGVEVDVLGRSAEVGAVWLRGGVVRAHRNADGKINLLALAPQSAPAPEPVVAGPAPVSTATPAPIATPAAPAAAAPAVVTASAPAAPAPAAKPAQTPFAWKVKTAGIEGLRVEWTDQVPKTPVSMVVEPIALKVDDLRPGDDVTWPFAFSTGLNAKGTLSLKGLIAPFRQKGEVELDLADLDLAPVAPYAADAAVQLVQGRLGIKGHATFDAADAEDPRWTWRGDVRLDGVRADDAAHRAEFVRWRSLEISGVEAASTPLSARISAIRLQDPVIRYVMYPGPATAKSAAAEPEAPAPEPAPAAKPAPLPPFSLGLLQIHRGRVSFVDRAVEPPVVVDTTSIEVKIAKLSTSATGRSSVDVRALVGGAAPVIVSGTLNPLRTDALTDIVLQAKGIDLVPLGPYAGKHLGYGLQKGKLDLDVRVQVQNRALSSANVVRIDQLTLGDKTDSPDATSLPVKLALAVVRDKDGVILIDLPVEGSLDDPQFRFGRVIWHVIVSVLEKAATAPFSALASLVGGDTADLSMLELAPGAAAPDEEGLRRVGQLAKALQERPGLGLEIEGTLDDARDREALQRVALAERLAKAKGPDAKPVSAEEYPALLAAMYRAAHPAETAQVTVPQMEARLLGAIDVPADALRALAADRAARARDAVLAAGIDPARVFLVEGGERAKAERGARVHFTLR